MTKNNKKKRNLILSIIVIVILLVGIFILNRETRFLDPVQYSLAQLFTNDLAYGSRAKSVLVVNMDDDEIFASRNESRKILPASLSKLFVIDYALTQVDLWDEVSVTSEVLNEVKSGSSVAWLYARNYYVHDLIVAMLVPSGNDATYALANHVGALNSSDSESTAKENIEIFTQNLNSYLQENGYNDTKINDPTGYDSAAYTTALDLKRVSKNLLENDWFRDIVSSSSYTVRVADDITQTWENTNKYLHEDSEYYNENVIGVKTGSFDGENNLIVLYKHNGEEYLICSLGSMSDLARYEDMNHILNAIDSEN